MVFLENPRGKPSPETERGPIFSEELVSFPVGRGRLLDRDANRRLSRGNAQFLSRRKMETPSGISRTPVCIKYKGTLVSLEQQKRERERERGREGEERKRKRTGALSSSFENRELGAKCAYKNFLRPPNGGVRCSCALSRTLRRLLNDREIRR